MADNTIKKNDFIELTYTGKVNDVVFDTTDIEVAKKFKLPVANIKPIVLCVGNSSILKSLDQNIEGKEVGKAYSVVLTAENAFGKKDASLIQLVPTSKFTKDKIMPQTGLHVNIDGQIAVVRKVSAGRTLVDFNHPLAGQDVTYDYKILRKIVDVKEKLASLVPVDKFTYDEKSGIVKINRALTPDMKVEAKKHLTALLPELKGIEFN
jgi:FKBP-type peptidyl-prolyl cis-trans isomerase SlyD